MKMKIHDPSEIHQILLPEYQGSTANIVLRLTINKTFSQQSYENALNKLIKSNPFINARYYRSTKNTYVYEELLDRKASMEYTVCSDNELLERLRTLSPNRQYLFDQCDGELIKLCIFCGNSFNLIEIAFSHIIGEVHSSILLAQRFLTLLDQPEVKPTKSKKYIFNESHFGWKKFNYSNSTITPSDRPKSLDIWNSLPDNNKRYKISKSDYFKLKQYLKNSGIEAKVSDLFYHTVYCILREILSKNIEIWLILGYRNSAISDLIKKSAYNFVFFSTVKKSILDIQGDQQWLETFYRSRKKLVTEEGVYQARNFLNSVNISIQNKKTDEGKKIMNSLIRFPEFSFNNYGKLDIFFKNLKNIKILDFDVQDGIPMQEIRYFMLNDQIHFNPTFYYNLGINTNEFIKKFCDKIKKTTGVALTLHENNLI